MADFSALKTSIQNYIKQNGNEEITGNLLQQILLSMVTTLGDSAINGLVTALNSEIATRGNADTELGGSITTLQGVVNGIVANIQNGYVYAGIATPSTTPVSGKVFYLALTAGTYTNFGATVVPQGINILKYNGSAWSLDSFLGLDDAPTQGSSNFVKSGGILDSIIKNGSAFDLSAYNDGSTYANLSAALTALNALPAAYKKGGMSMKFVQTSDNKYVQARCMAQNFTTDVTQWQGVDEEPIAGSDNLITSGSVYNVNKTLQEEIDPLLDEIKTSYLSPINSNIYSDKIIQLKKDVIYTFTFTPDADMYNSQHSQSTADGYFNFKVVDANTSTTLAKARESYFAEAGVPYSVTYTPQQDVDVKVGSGALNMGVRVDVNVDITHFDSSIFWETQDCTVVFRGSYYPTFSIGRNNIVLTMPDTDAFYVRGSNAKTSIEISVTRNQSYTITNNTALVYDFSDKTIKVIPIATVGNYLTLFNLSALGDGTLNIDGCFKNFYFGFLTDRITKNRISIDSLSSELFGNTNALENISLGSDGTYTERNGYCVTKNYVNVVSGSCLIWVTGRISESNVNGYLVQYDASNNIVGSPLTMNAERRVITLETNCAKVKAAFILNRKDIGLYDGEGNAIYVPVISSIKNELSKDASDILQYYSANHKNDINNIRRWSDLKLFFFSDVHAGENNVKRIFDLATAWTSANVDCIINGGDTVNSLMNEGLSWYNELVDGCDIPILHTAGNHDCWKDSTWNFASGVDIYNLITAKVKQQVPTIVQPANAATNGLNYYYKDFGNIRVICILSISTSDSEIYFDSAQNTWLESVLENARTTYHYWKIVSGSPQAYTLQAGDTITATLTCDADLNNHPYNYYQDGQIYAVPMGVIIVNHTPYGADVAERVESKKINSWLDYTKDCFAKNLKFDKLHLSEDAVETINTYIQAGGSFICWLTGHTHSDNVLVHSTYQGQLMININSANYSRKSDGVAATSDADPNYDSFDYIGVDQKSAMIKILRMGWAEDSSMRIRRAWCYDYLHQKLVSED